MSKISFLGAAREVTGSMFLVESSNGKKVLVDCGLHQGSKLDERRNYDSLPFDAKSIDLVVVTHAHLDHVGRLPKLVKDGFNGPVILTAPTADLMHLVLVDAQGIMEDDATKVGHEPLYGVEDINRLMQKVERVEYDVTTTLHGMTVRLVDAGHILGSSSAQLIDNGKTIVFSGDLGNAGAPILQPTKAPEQADVVVMESTYGGRVHEPIGERENILRQTIMETVNRRGVLMIPAFAIERSQEILYEIDQLQKEKKIPQLPIFLDSPLAINATAVFERYSQFWNKESQVLKSSGDDFFRFPGLKQTVTVQQSKEINEVAPPKIIIAGSGMMEGGRILHHLQRYLPNEKSTLLVVGYQAKGTLGRELLDRVSRVKIHGQWVNVRAQIKPIGAYSAHADGPQLLLWLSKFTQKPKHVYLVHGENGEMETLAANIKKDLNIAVTIPSQGDVVVDEQTDRDDLRVSGG